MEKRLKDAGYIKRDGYFVNECCHCAHKKKIDDVTLYCTKLNIYVGEEFVYQGDGEKTLILEGQELVPQFIDTHTSKFDFSMELTPLKSGCRMRLEYNLARYDEQLMDKLADVYLCILLQLDKERIADISVLPEHEYHRVVEEFNDTYVEYPRDKCVHELFSEQVERTPEKIALVFEDKKFTYKQVDEMSNSLAHFLREKEGKPNDVVPIIAKRSWHVIVAMLGILKAGGAYILIDNQYPKERILYLIRESRACITLIYTDISLNVKYLDLKKFDYNDNVEIIDSVNNSHDILCAIHTSGSTGVPKLTTLSHRNIVHYFTDATYFFEGIDQVIATTSITFDAFIQETLIALCRNISIILAGNDQIFNQTEFENIINKYENSFLFQTPTKLLSYIKNSKSNALISKIKRFIIGGEVFPNELYEKIRLSNPDGDILNIYGPTETTICISTKKITSQEDITIGKPIANTQIYILGTDGNPLPIGVAGELCIAGEGVGKGYLNRPELTAERFVPNPFATEENHHGKVMYHTGDLARWREDGEIEYLGRIDTQVKIRGLRIELGEIESVMATMEGTELTAVADKRAEDNRQANEKTLCHLLEELLHMERVGTQDDFFENGGDSLTAIEYTAKAHSAEIDFSLQNVFDYPTVQLLCDFLQKGESSKENYRASDFDKYQKLFARNKIEESFVPKKKALGNILLTGATGFLGAHVLDFLMREETGKIYCLVRSEKKGSGHERVRRILQHYFGNQYDTEFDRRIILIEGDIERENLSENMPEYVQTVIHTAASVSHYGSYEYFHRVNVEGTRHIVN